MDENTFSALALIALVAVIAPLSIAEVERERKTAQAQLSRVVPGGKLVT